MAGGGGAMQAPEKVKRGKTSRRKKKKRLGFHIDMTPLVDITFLLLTFFMFTTTMLKPQIMEMKMPPEIFTDVEVQASKLLTLYLFDEGQLFYAQGMDDPEKLEIDKLADFAVEQNLKKELRNELITSLKVYDEAKFDDVIRVLDQLNIAEVPITEAISKDLDDEGNQMERKRRFTLGVVSLEERNKIDSLYNIFEEEPQ
jgi:biopolymer transport protein ExbD